MNNLQTQNKAIWHCEKCNRLEFGIKAKGLFEFELVSILLSVMSYQDGLISLDVEY